MIEACLRASSVLAPPRLGWKTGTEKETKANTAQGKMTTSADSETQRQGDKPGATHATREFVRRLVRLRLVRELFVILTFCLLTSVVTWPYVTRMRDAVVDPGDPYLISWILWWDYHQTFSNPLHLFDANLFYPLRYTLAFSEHSYGLALLLFPLFALGAKPLTVHAIAMFFGFVLSGYGAFRLGRTLTGSTKVGWVAGIVFAFVPYRFSLMSQVVYLFTPWIPLLFEALVLFARERTTKRATWLGIAFFMSGLTAITWFVYSLIPLVVFAGILLTRYEIWRDRQFWRRGLVSLTTASLLLLPFMVPYVLVSRLYGFRRSIDEIKVNSAWPIHWLSVESRNKLWGKMGDGIPEGYRFKLFPGLLPILFSLAALLLPGGRAKLTGQPLTGNEARLSNGRWLRRLDILIIFAFAASILAIGFDGTDAFRKLFFRHITSERALTLLCISVIVRLCLAYPAFLRPLNANLIETIRSPRRGDAFWLGTLLTAIGFSYSLGWNFFFYRICYALLPPFESLRVPTRGAMLAYLGLALLSGLGVERLGELYNSRMPRLRSSGVVLIACAALLLELNAAPLSFMRGEVYPDAVTLRLKQTPMRGGIVLLPAGGGFNYPYMLRSTEHQKPLIVGTSGFNSPIEDKIEALIRAGAIPTELLDLFEAVPASYLVIENQSIVPERSTDYEEFLGRGLVSGRLRFINRFDGHSDLYAVVKTEPDARSEAALPFHASIRDWASKIHEDPVNILADAKRSQTLYRIFFASTGTLPRYAEFIIDVEALGRGVMSGVKEEEQLFQSNLSRFLEEWVRRERFTRTFGPLNNQQYVDRLLENAGVNAEASRGKALVSSLESGQDTRAGVLLKIVEDPIFFEKENKRSLLLLHYFAYLRRNPGEPPDRDLSGFNFWLHDFESNHNPAKLSSAFKDSIEYGQIKNRR